MRRILEIALKIPMAGPGGVLRAPSLGHKAKEGFEVASRHSVLDFEDDRAAARL